VSILALPTTVSEHRPRFEGVNIRTWVGFKHLMYLVEEAVLDWLRVYTPGTRRLFCDSGLGVEFIDSSVQLPAPLEVDDQVRAQVTAVEPGRFTVTLHALRGGEEVPVLRGKIALTLVRETGAPVNVPLAVGAELLPEPVAEIALEAEPGPDQAFGWTWRVPYYYCHFSERLQHSGHVRPGADAGGGVPGGVGAHDVRGRRCAPGHDVRRAYGFLCGT
jgi:acyl-CoA thioesterase FadM